MNAETGIFRKRRGLRIFEIEIIAAVVLLVLCACEVRSGEGTTSGVVLSIPVSGRACAMGGAYTAVAGGADSIHYNPAGLADLIYGETSVKYQSGISDDTLAILDFAYPLDAFNAGISLINYSAGNITLISETGALRNVKAQQDSVVILALGGNLQDNILGGLNIKMMNSRLVDEFGATASAIDAGIIWKGFPAGISAGLAVGNIGTGLKYSNVSEKLPSVVRGGILAEFHTENKSIINVTADIIKPFEGEMEKRAGFEYGFSSKYFLRCGLNAGMQHNAFSAGFGICLETVKVDYAWIPDSELDVAHRITVTAILKTAKMKARADAEREPGLLLVSRYFMEAMELFNSGKYKDAKKKWEKIRVIIPNHSESRKHIRLCRRKIYENLSANKKADMAYKYLKKGEKYIEKGKYKKAVEYLERAQVLDPELKQTGYMLKDLYRKLTE